jgi:hypothetical protein
MARILRREMESEETGSVVGYNTPYKPFVSRKHSVYGREGIRHGTERFGNSQRAFQRLLRFYFL